MNPPTLGSAHPCVKLFPRKIQGFPYPPALAPNPAITSLSNRFERTPGREATAIDVVKNLSRPSSLPSTNEEPGCCGINRGSPSCSECHNHNKAPVISAPTTNPQTIALKRLEFFMLIWSQGTSRPPAFMIHRNQALKWSHRQSFCR